MASPRNLADGRPAGPPSGTTTPPVGAGLFSKRARQIQEEEGVTPAPYRPPALREHASHPPSPSSTPTPPLPSDHPSNDPPRLTRGRARAGTMPSNLALAAQRYSSPLVSTIRDSGSELDSSSDLDAASSAGVADFLGRSRASSNASAFNPSPYGGFGSSTLAGMPSSRPGLPPPGLAGSSISTRLRSGSLNLPASGLSNPFGPSIFSSGWLANSGRPSASSNSSLANLATIEGSIHSNDSIGETDQHVRTLDYLGLDDSLSSSGSLAAQFQQHQSNPSPASSIPQRLRANTLASSARPRPSPFSRTRSSSFLPNPPDELPGYAEGGPTVPDDMPSRAHSGGYRGVQGEVNYEALLAAGVAGLPYASTLPRSFSHQSRLSQQLAAAMAVASAPLGTTHSGTSSPGGDISDASSANVAAAVAAAAAAAHRPRAISVGVLEGPQQLYLRRVQQQLDAAFGVAPSSGLQNEYEYEYDADRSLPPSSDRDIGGARPGHPGPAGATGGSSLSRPRSEKDLARMAARIAAASADPGALMNGNGGSETAPASAGIGGLPSSHGGYFSGSYSQQQHQPQASAGPRMNKTQSAGAAMSGVGGGSSGVGGGGGGGGQPPSRSLWIGNLDPTTSAQELMQVFAPYGAIESLRLLPDKECGFVNFVEMSDAIRARDDVLNRLGGKISANATGPNGTVRIGFGKVDSAPVPHTPGSSLAYGGPVAQGSPARGFTSPPSKGTVGNVGEVVGTPGETPSQPTRALWIGSIPSSTTPSTLLSIFSPFGPIESARVLTHKNCGFVNFERVDDAVRARKALNGRDVLGSEVGTVRIGFAKVPVKGADSPASSKADVGKVAGDHPSPTSLAAAMEALRSLQGSSAVPIDQQLLSGNVENFRSNMVINLLSNQNGGAAAPAFAANGFSPSAGATAAAQALMAAVDSKKGLVAVGSDKGGVPLPPELVPTDSISDQQLLMKELSEGSPDLEADVESVAEPRPPVSYYTSVPLVSDVNQNRRFDATKLREMRKRIDSGQLSQREVDGLADDLLDECTELSSDYIGNTVIQKLFERCSSPVKLKMLERIAPHLAMIGIHKNGTWAAQKIIDCAKEPDQIALVNQNLRPYVPPLLLDQFGNYVVQCALPYKSPINDFIFDAMVDRTWEIAQGRFGARSMRACLESSHVSKRQQKRIAISIILNSIPLATSPNGALLLTWLLDTSGLPNRYRLLAPRFAPHLSHLCTHKLASLTVLRIVNQKSDPDASKIILKALFDSPQDSVLSEVLGDQVHGINLVQKILERADPAEKPRMVEAVKRVLTGELKATGVPAYRRLVEEVGLPVTNPPTISGGLGGGLGAPMPPFTGAPNPYGPSPDLASLMAAMQLQAASANMLHQHQAATSAAGHQGPPPPAISGLPGLQGGGGPMSQTGAPGFGSPLRISTSTSNIPPYAGNLASPQSDPYNPFMNRGPASPDGTSSVRSPQTPRGGGGGGALGPGGGGGGGGVGRRRGAAGAPANSTPRTFGAGGELGSPQAGAGAGAAAAYTAVPPASMDASIYGSFLQGQSLGYPIPGQQTYP